MVRFVVVAKGIIVVAAVVMCLGAVQTKWLVLEDGVLFFVMGPELVCIVLAVKSNPVVVRSKLALGVEKTEVMAAEPVD